MIQEGNVISSGRVSIGRHQLKPGESIHIDRRGREAGQIEIYPIAPDPRPGWPQDARFRNGQEVERAGERPIRGVICGWARGSNAKLFYAVEREGEPGRLALAAEPDLQPRTAE